MMKNSLGGWILIVLGAASLKIDHNATPALVLMGLGSFMIADAKSQK